ncbi:unknown protein [Desulfotalea psychrophila LSv54]|uniref:Uncharacterized protein n=2 Tax=Desulfotalea psychrophila TaxID=84980 RepID=Q6AQE1_DESPS|nr:unknown protein [Desulfotalea psychrophila LSv54]
MTEISSDITPGKLLSLSERTICEKVAQQEVISDSKRATALLSIDDGMTQTQAAKASSMTLGQLRYALVLFKKSGLQMFADTDPALIAISPAPEVPAEETEVMDVPEPAETEKINLTTAPDSAKVEMDNSIIPVKKEKKKMAKKKKNDKDSKKKDKKEQKLLSLKEQSEKEKKKKAKKKKEKKKGKKQEDGKTPKEAACKKKDKKNK